MSVFEKQYETLFDNGSRISVITSILFLLGFIVYARYMVTSGTFPLSPDEIQPFPAMVVLASSLVVFFFLFYYGFALSTYFMVFASFMKSGTKKKDDYHFFIEKGLVFLFEFSLLAIYHLVAIKAKDGFGFFPTILFIIGFVLYYTICDYLHPKLTLFLVSFFGESEKELNPSKESHVKTSFQKKPKNQKSVIRIDESEIQTFKNTLHLIYETDFSSIQSSLIYVVDYIYKNQSYLTEVNERHIYKRIISQDTLNLISSYTSLDSQDKESYRVHVLNELSQIVNELHKLKNRIDDMKRSHMDKSLLLSKERYN